MEPKVFVIYHRSKEFYRDLLSFPDEPTHNRENIILKALKGWEDHFNLSYEEVKRRIVKIAFMGIENWECDGIINWREGDHILQKVGEQFDNAFYFQLDDDDWINPALFPTLKEKLQEKKFKAMCWDATHHDCATQEPQLFDRKCKEVLAKENKDAGTPGIFFGGTYGFKIKPGGGINTGLHNHSHFDYLRSKEKEGELLKLSDQPYYFRLSNPTGRGWLKYTGNIGAAYSLAVAQLEFFKDFDSTDFFFHEQATAYTKLLEEMLDGKN